MTAHTLRGRPLRILGIVLIAIGIAGFTYVNLLGMQRRFPVPPDGRVFYGVQLDWNADSPKEYGTRLGQTPKVFGIYGEYPINDSLKKLIDDNIPTLTSHKSTLMLTLEPLDGLQTINYSDLEDLRITLTQWNNKGLPVLVRFAHEMNGAWYPWGQQPTAYKAAFRQVATAVRHAPGSSMLWSPNEGGGYPYAGGEFEAKPPSRDFELLDTNNDGVLTMDDDPYTPYYPGDEYVDWVGLSSYHFGTAWPWGRNTIPKDNKFEDKITGDFKNDRTDETMLPNFYELFAEGHNKPFAISETSALYINRPNNGADNEVIKKVWIDQVYTASLVTKFPRLKLITWFEYQKAERDTTPSPVNWTVTVDDEVRSYLQAKLPDWLVYGRSY